MYITPNAFFPIFFGLVVKNVFSYCEYSLKINCVGEGIRKARQDRVYRWEGGRRDSHDYILKLIRWPAPQGSAYPGGQFNIPFVILQYFKTDISKL